MSEATLFDAAIAARRPHLSTRQRYALQAMAAGGVLYRIPGNYELGRFGRRFKLDTIRALVTHRLLVSGSDGRGHPVLKISPAGELLVAQWRERKQA